GMRLFHAESSDRSEKVLPRFESVSKAIVFSYLALSLACAVAYYFAGMSVFDAVNHAMTTVATGGFSTYDASMGYFNDTPSILWIAVVFMVLGALPFVLYVQLLRGSPSAFWKDRQVSGFLGIVLFFGMLLALVNGIAQGRDPASALTASFFNVVSIISTTGFASEDYSLWGEQA